MLINSKNSKKLLLGLLFLGLFCATAQARYCHYCYSPSYGYGYSYNYYAPTDTGIIQRDDDTFWRGDIQLEKIRKLQYDSYGKAKWVWGYVPKPGQKLQGFQAYSKSYAEQGRSIYGFSQLKEVYRPTDLSLPFAQAGRLAESALALGSGATTNLNALIETEGNRQSKVAEIVAKGQALTQAFQALNGPPGQDKSSITLRINGNGSVERLNGNNQPQQPQQQQINNTEALQQLIQNRCYSCHNNKKASGKLSFDNINQFTGDVWLKIQEKITDPDITKRMPLAPDLSPGEILTAQDMKLFFQM